MFGSGSSFWACCATARCGAQTAVVSASNAAVRWNLGLMLPPIGIANVGLFDANHGLEHQLGAGTPTGNLSRALMLLNSPCTRFIGDWGTIPRQRSSDS